MWDRIHPPSVPSTPQSCGLPGLQDGQRWRGGRLLPRPPVTYLLLPGSLRRGGAAACALARASRRISHAAAPGAPPMPQRAREWRSFSDLFREGAGCRQELKLLCKEQRRRAGAGRRPRGPPPTPGLQPPPPGTEPNWRWEFTCPTASPSGPGCAHLSSPGSAALPEHSRKGRQERRQRRPKHRLHRLHRRRRRQQQQDAELRPRRAPAQPSVPREGLAAAAAAGQGATGHPLAGCGMLRGDRLQVESSEGD